MKKRAASIGSAPSDPVKSEAATSPTPFPVLENKPAPGLHGPHGLSPRTTYSRVNAVSPPASPSIDGLKASPARGAEFLPAKMAQAEGLNMTMTHRPTLNDMVKAAMQGTANRIQVTNEAARQLARFRGDDEEEKVASAETPDHYPTEHIMKMAAALDYIAETVKVADSGNVQQPGQGPGALEVLESNVAGTTLEAGQSGHAVSADQVPKNPALQAEEVQAGKANTGLETNDDMSHPEQPVEPIKNETAKLSAALYQKNLQRLLKVAEGDPEGHMVRRAILGTPISAAIEARKGKKLDALGETLGHGIKEWGKSVGAGGFTGAALGGIAGGIRGAAKGGTKGILPGAGTGALIGGAGGAGAGSLYGGIKGSYGAEASKLHGKYSKHKEAGAPVALLRKLAEDAINPAQISAGAAVPPDTSEAEQGQVSVPSDVSSQVSSMLSSNDAAINYTKGQAKANPKSDVNQLLVQPALTREGDSVLHQVFDNTGAAGVKISQASSIVGDSVKVAAARALLSQMLDEGGHSKEASWAATAKKGVTEAAGSVKRTAVKFGKDVHGDVARTSQKVAPNSTHARAAAKDTRNARLIAGGVAGAGGAAAYQAGKKKQSNLGAAPSSPSSASGFSASSLG